jgi:hypothetical protein
MALLFFFRTLVLKEDFASASEPRFHKHQRAVSVDGQRLRFFFDALALDIFAAYTYSDLHQYPLAAASRYWVHGVLWT